MPRGGARRRSGPPPDPNALRRDRPSDKATWTYLPAVGRQGEPPAWPLIRPTKRELGMWAEEWSRPQAIIWEQNRQELEVALYVRTAIEAERRGTTASMRRLVRQQQLDLGLTLEGLLRNRWIVADDVPASALPSGRRRDAGSMKDRVKVIIGGGGA